MDGATAAELARRAAEEGAERVVAVGGDGTAVDVAAGLLAAARPAPLAHVPCGTANALALNLGIPRAVEGAVAAAVTGVETRVDVGVLRGAEPFLLTVGTGLHARVVERADRRAKRRWGVGAYLWAGWSALAETPPARYRLTVDGEEEEIEATMVQVVNCGALFRTSWMMGPGISPVDGELDVLVYRARSRSEYARVAARFVQGAPTATALVRHLRGAHVRVAADADVPVQRDGEPAGALPIEIAVRPGALPVIVPSSSPWARAAERGAAADGAAAARP